MLLARVLGYELQQIAWKGDTPEETWKKHITPVLAESTRCLVRNFGHFWVYKKYVRFPS